LSNALGWRRGVIVFDHTTLADAAAELNRYNHQQIVVADPAAALMRIDATLPVNGVEAIVRVAQDVLGVRAHKDRNGRIVITR
jgi:transmembrane sensor